MKTNIQTDVGEFKALGLNEDILKALEEKGFSQPTEVQIKAIPLILAGKDVIAGAATGSGKTLAFGSGIIQSCEGTGVIQSLVLVPTRELAEQVSQTLKSFSKHKRLRITEVYGGVSINPQIDKLRRAEVVVGTPGRILDHLQRETINLSKVKILVLDEADRMLDMGFIRDVKKIIGQCPRERQTLLFSATISADVQKLSGAYMHDPQEVDCESLVDPKKLTQFYYDVPDNMKFSLLVHLLKQERVGLAMVFCNTQRNTDFVARNLQASGINAMAIHGGHSQDKRKMTMEKFHSKDVDVLVCTDVAARGLDIKGVSHVYNYDVPKEPNQYIHRIGRTARAGAEGKAVTVLGSRDYDNFDRLQRKEEVTITRLENPEVERVFIKIKDEEIRRPYSGRSFPRGRSFGGGRSNSYRGSSNRNFSRGRSSYGEGDREERSGSTGGYGRRSGSDFRGSRNSGRSGGYGRSSSRDNRNKSSFKSRRPRY